MLDYEMEKKLKFYGSKKEEIQMQDFLQEEIEEREDTGIELIDIHQPASRPEKKEPDGGKRDEEPVNWFKEILSLLGTMAVAAVAVMLLKEFVIINAFIPSGSMEHTISPGDRVIGNRLAYKSDEPERGDIVIFKYPDDETQLFVKRVIGLPGETVTIEDAKVYVEGTILPEDYLKEEWTLDNGPYTFEIPEGSYLVLGDNRNNSKDARYWENTYVEAEQILGKAVFRYWPFNQMGTLE